MKRITACFALGAALTACVADPTEAPAVGSDEQEVQNTAPLPGTLLKFKRLATGYVPTGSSDPAYMCQATASVSSQYVPVASGNVLVEFGTTLKNPNGIEANYMALCQDTTLLQSVEMHPNPTANASGAIMVPAVAGSPLNLRLAVIKDYYPSTQSDTWLKLTAGT